MEQEDCNKKCFSVSNCEYFFESNYLINLLISCSTKLAIISADKPVSSSCLLYCKVIVNTEISEYKVVFLNGQLLDCDIIILKINKLCFTLLLLKCK